MITRREAIAKENKAYKERIKQIDKFFDFVERHNIKKQGDEVKYKGVIMTVSICDTVNYELLLYPNIYVVERPSTYAI